MQVCGAGGKMSEGSSPQQVTVAAVVTARVHLQDTLRQARLRAQDSDNNASL